MMMQEVDNENESKKEDIKLKIKKLRLFEHVWMKLSQCIALIEEEFPRIKEFKDNIPKETIRVFVIETRKDLKDLEEAMHYVESATLSEVPVERIPKWFEDEPEITDEELENEFYKDFVNESDIGDISQYDSILNKLRANIRNHTQSFFEPEKALTDSFIHNYDWNEMGNKDYNDLFMQRRMTKQEDDNLRRSMIINNGHNEGDGEGEGDQDNILDFSF